NRSTRLEDPSQLLQGARGVRDAAEGPRQDHRVRTRAVQRKILRGPAKQLHRIGESGYFRLCSGQKLRRGVETPHVAHVGAIEWEVEARPDAHLQNPAGRLRDDLGSTLGTNRVLHRKIDEVRQYELVVESHALIPFPS